MIVSGGYNIYSVEVEHALAAHPAVAEVAVVGVPHPRWGESVCAFIVPRAGAAIDEPALDAQCRQTLPPYKCPKQYVFIDSLPMTTTGKVRKTELRAQMTTTVAQGRASNPPPRIAHDQ
jgi:acyl-CoA synthetase (AMP-forming)/AMP-acid ligase II